MRITNPMCAGSSPVRPTKYLSGCPVLTTGGNRNPVGPVKEAGLHPGRVIQIIQPSWISCKGGRMNVLKPHKKLAVISALIEGCSVPATSRITGVHKTTIFKVLVEMGEKCEILSSRRLSLIASTSRRVDGIPWELAGLSNHPFALAPPAVQCWGVRRDSRIGID